MRNETFKKQNKATVQGLEQNKAVKVFDSWAFVTQEQKQHRLAQGRDQQQKGWSLAAQGSILF